MAEQANLSEKEKAKLRDEYRECCVDWRWRDKYVLDKLSAAGILFMLLGVALGTIPRESYIIRLCLLAIGSLFSLLLVISIAKDTYYRDGSEKLVRRLSAQLGISDSLQTLKSLKGFDDGLNFQDLQFPRKISIKRDKSSLALPKRLRNWLLDRRTFKLILAFYLGSLSIFTILFILILVNLICGLSLPI